MMTEHFPIYDAYTNHLQETIDWLLLSIENGEGGSSAYFSPLSGWSKPYPETTGYIISTLIDAASHLDCPELLDTAISLGRWLTALQQPEGWWPGGVYRGEAYFSPSVFNTAQIIDGMVSLFEATGEASWIDSARQGTLWLAQNVDQEGSWCIGNYQNDFNPSYYTQVAWPMLRYWQREPVDEIRNAAERVLDRIISQCTQVATVRNWGFMPDKPAFTHTIAYTLRGLVESAIILDSWAAYGQPIEKILERFVRKAEFGSGRLAGAYGEDWRAVKWYSCLTGNVQIAQCLLRYEERENDLRLVNAATKLIDYVCSKQIINKGPMAKRGAVAGSSPLWGSYMFMRYPNWAAKYHADSIIMLQRRLAREKDY